MPLITALRRQRQKDVCEFEASFVTELVLGQLGLHKETLSQKPLKKKKGGKQLKKIPVSTSDLYMHKLTCVYIHAHNIELEV